MRSFPLDISVPAMQAVWVRGCLRTGRSLWMHDADERLYVVPNPCIADRRGSPSRRARSAFSWLLCRALDLSSAQAAKLNAHAVLARQTTYFKGPEVVALFGLEVPYRDGSLFDYTPRSRRVAVSNLAEIRSWQIGDYAASTQAMFLKTGPDSFTTLKTNHGKALEPDRPGQLLANPLDGIADSGSRAALADNIRLLVDEIGELASTPGHLEALAGLVPLEFGERPWLAAAIPALRRRARDLCAAAGALTAPTPSSSRVATSIRTALSVG